MKIEVPHALAPAEARARMMELGRYWQTKYGIRPTWTGERAVLAGSFMGHGFDAAIEVGRSAVVLEGPDPNRLIRTSAVSYLERKMSEYLNPGNSLRRLRARRTTQGGGIP